MKNLATIEKHLNQTGHKVTILSGTLTVHLPMFSKVLIINEGENLKFEVKFGNLKRTTALYVDLMIVSLSVSLFASYKFVPPHDILFFVMLGIGGIIFEAIRWSNSEHFITRVCNFVSQKE